MSADCDRKPWTVRVLQMWRMTTRRITPRVFVPSWSAVTRPGGWADVATGVPLRHFLQMLTAGTLPSAEGLLSSQRARASEYMTSHLYMTSHCHGAEYKRYRVERYDDAWPGRSLSTFARFEIRSSVFWDVTQHKFVVNYRRFGKTYLSHFQGSGSLWRILLRI